MDKNKISVYLLFLGKIKKKRKKKRTNCILNRQIRLYITAILDRNVFVYV